MFEIVNEINNNEFATTTQNPECFKDNYIVKHVIGSSVEEYLKYGLLDIENVTKEKHTISNYRFCVDNYGRECLLMIKELHKYFLYKGEYIRGNEFK